MKHTQYLTSVLLVLVPCVRTGTHLIRVLMMMRMMQRGEALSQASGEVAHHVAILHPHDSIKRSGEGLVQMHLANCVRDCVRA